MKLLIARFPRPLAILRQSFSPNWSSTRKSHCVFESTGTIKDHEKLISKQGTYSVLVTKLALQVTPSTLRTAPTYKFKNLLRIII